MKSVVVKLPKPDELVELVLDVDEAALLDVEGMADMQASLLRDRFPDDGSHLQLKGSAHDCYRHNPAAEFSQVVQSPTREAALNGPGVKLLLFGSLGNCSQASEAFRHT